MAQIETKTGVPSRMRPDKQKQAHKKRSNGEGIIIGTLPDHVIEKEAP
ncbi:hypothetical protein [Cyclobacterium jeungdonense]|nr:hypothetical protein [Cyclobacterium jeungdonense]